MFGMAMSVTVVCLQSCFQSSFFYRVIPHYLSVDSFDLATYKLVVARTSPLCLSSSSFLLSGSILIRLHALFTL